MDKLHELTMSDDRSLIEKLEAMAAQDESPEEAEVAAAILARMQSRRSSHKGESTKSLTRERIMAAPNATSLQRAVRLHMGGTVYLFDEQDVPWGLVHEAGLQAEYVFQEEAPQPEN
jgi:hypothetical protein